MRDSQKQALEDFGGRIEALSDLVNVVVDRAMTELDDEFFDHTQLWFVWIRFKRTGNMPQVLRRIKADYETYLYEKRRGRGK